MASLKHRLFAGTLAAFSAARFPDWAPAVRGARGVVLTLHRVQPDPGEAFNPNGHLSITPDFLEKAIVALKAAGRRFVSLDEILTTGNGADSGHRIAVTLDDGFRDNLEHAWPVFARHDVPFTIFVCTGFSDRTAEIWWEALERITRTSSEVSLPDEPGAPAMPARSVAEKNRAFAAWRAWLTGNVDEARQRTVIRKLAARYGLDLSAMAAGLIMDWDELRRIAADPLCRIGAHTLTHPALARLSSAAARHEMAESADRIAQEIGYRPTTIAFPYGYRSAAGPREAALAAEAGFAASFVTRPGFLPGNGGSHGLPRVSVNGHHHSVAALRVLVTPAFWALGRRFKPSLSATGAVGPSRK